MRLLVSLRAEVLWVVFLLLYWCTDAFAEGVAKVHCQWFNSHPEKIATDLFLKNIDAFKGLLAAPGGCFMKIKIALMVPTGTTFLTTELNFFCHALLQFLKG